MELDDAEGVPLEEYLTCKSPYVRRRWSSIAATRIKLTNATAVICKTGCAKFSNWKKFRFAYFCAIRRDDLLIMSKMGDSVAYSKNATISFAICARHAFP